VLHRSRINRFLFLSFLTQDLLISFLSLSLSLAWQSFQNRGAQIYVYITLSDHRLDTFP